MREYRNSPMQTVGIEINSTALPAVWMSAPKTKIRRRDQKLATRDAKERAGRADTQTESDTDDDLSTEIGRHQSRQASGQEPLADQQHADRHQEDGNRAFKAMIRDMGE